MSARASCAAWAADERHGALSRPSAPCRLPAATLREPVSQATMRIVKVFWALDASPGLSPPLPGHQLAELLFAVPQTRLRPWFDEHLGVEFMEHRDKAMHMLQQESELQEIVQLVGKDALVPGDQPDAGGRAVCMREDFLQQNAFMDVDSYTGFDRQERMLLHDPAL